MGQRSKGYTYIYIYTEYTHTHTVVCISLGKQNLQKLPKQNQAGA